jgi:hypothetical protein
MVEGLLSTSITSDDSEGVAGEELTDGDSFMRSWKWLMSFSREVQARTIDVRFLEGIGPTQAGTARQI